MINYFKNDRRTTPINVAIARATVSLFVIWKMFNYNWRVYPLWPSPLDNILPVFRREIIFMHIELLALLCGIMAFCVLIGYRLEFSVWVTAVLLTYLGSVRKTLQISHGSEILFTAALILVIFAIFGNEDKITVDQLRRTRRWELGSLTTHLETSTESFRHRGLKWSLVVIGFFYFQTGFSKLVFGDPIAWIHSSSLGRYLLYRMGDGPSRFFSEFMLQYPSLLTLTAVVTLVLEVGFLLAIVFKKPVWPFFIGVIGMHIAIKFSLGPDFTDQVFLLAIFFPWDYVIKYMQNSEELVIVYDEHCFFCARSLHLFKYFDVNSVVTYYNQYDVPEHFETENTDFETAMYAFREGESFRGYRAFRELFRQLGFVPVAYCMSIPGVIHVGERAYRYIAENRSRYFVCSTEA